MPNMSLPLESIAGNFNHDEVELGAMRLLVSVSQPCLWVLPFVGRVYSCCDWNLQDCAANGRVKSGVL
jgi:hypothetical protein